MDLGDVAASIKAEQDPAAIATAIDLLDRAVANGAVITSIEAQDEALSYRSVPFVFTVEQSAVIFAAIKQLLGG